MFIDLTLPIADNDNPFSSNSPVAKYGHMGTHLDKTPTAIIPVNRFISTGKLVDVSHIREKKIEPADFPESVSIEKDDFVIIKTNWLQEHYPDKTYFGLYPELSQASIDYLISKNINMIGIDTPGLTRSDTHSDVDRYLLKHDIFVVENLNNVPLLTKTEFIIYCFPMNLQQVTGLPVRIIAAL